MQFKDFTDEYVTLAPDGEIENFTGGEQFWSQSGESLNAAAQNWLLSGDADLILELEGVVQKFDIRGRDSAIVPAGPWHTAKVLSPVRMLAITRGAGTENKLAA